MNNAETDNPQKMIMLIDGVCNLCNHTVKFTVKHDFRKRILIAALQSDAGQRLLKQHGLPLSDFQSFVWIEKGEAYTRSTGALKYFKALRGLWALLYAFIIIPKPIRDTVYDFVSRRRYRWFGKSETCFVPTPELKSRFLD